MLREILNKSWRQHPSKQQLYGHLPPIMKIFKIRRTRHAGHCWRSRDEFISDVFLWTPSRGRAKAGRPARTKIQQLYVDTGCSPEDLPEAIDDWEELAKEGHGYPPWWCNMMMIINFVQTNDSYKIDVLVWGMNSCDHLNVSKNLINIKYNY